MIECENEPSVEVTAVPLTVVSSGRVYVRTISVPGMAGETDPETVTEDLDSTASLDSEIDRVEVERVGTAETMKMSNWSWGGDLLDEKATFVPSGLGHRGYG